MVSDSSWEREAAWGEHPGDDYLLAFIRGQCSEQDKRLISAHLTGCALCSEAYAGLAQSSRTLSQIKHMSRYSYYPELNAEKVLAHAQRGVSITSAWTGKRKRGWTSEETRSITSVHELLPGTMRGSSSRASRKSSFRIASLPAGLGIALIFTSVMLVLAYTVISLAKFSFMPGAPPIHIYHEEPDVNSVVPHLTSPTPTYTVSVVASVSSTATSVVSDKPTIIICSSPASITLVVCGYNFKAHDRVSLILNMYGARSFTMRRPSTVDSLGEFHDSWHVFDCRFVPVAIFAQDISQKPAIVSNVLRNIQVAGCNRAMPPAKINS